MRNEEYSYHDDDYDAECPRIFGEREAGRNKLSGNYGTSSKWSVASNNSQRFCQNDAETLTNRKIDSPLHATRPADGDPWEQIPSTSTALSDTRSVTDEYLEETGSVNIRFLESFFSPRCNIRINSSSINQRLVGEIDVAATVRELDHSRFVFDKHQMEFETLDPKNATRIMKITQAEFKRKIDSLEETQYKNECPRFTGRQIMVQVELYNDKQDAWRTECDL